jgi:hypothetical protein
MNLTSCRLACVSTLGTSAAGLRPADRVAAAVLATRDADRVPGVPALRAVRHRGRLHGRLVRGLRAGADELPRLHGASPRESRGSGSGASP